MKALTGLIVAIALLLGGTTYASVASVPREYRLEASGCFSDNDSSRVTLSWSTAPSVLPISGYAYGIAYATTMALIVSDTVGADVRNVTASIPCPAFGESVSLVGGVRAIDSLNREGEVGTDTLTLRTAVPSPPGAPAVSLDTIASLTGEGTILYDNLSVVMGDSIQLCYYVEYIDGTLGLDPDIPFCRGLAGVPLDFSIRHVAYWSNRIAPL